MACGLVCLLGLFLWTPDTHRPSHVRSSIPWMTALLADGCRRSPTMRSLVDALEASDVYVYVEPSPGTPGGRLQFADATPRGRYLRVLVSPRHDDTRVIALIAHELHHALEVATSPDVVDEESMRALYERIGVRRAKCGRSANCYETEAAQTTTGIVFKEICGRSVPPDGLTAHAR